MGSPMRPAAHRTGELKRARRRRGARSTRSSRTIPTPTGPWRRTARGSRRSWPAGASGRRRIFKARARGGGRAPLGVVVVPPPWNFPLSIPAGGVLAALAAGNAVVLKPAPEAVLVGSWLATCLWDAGVPREILQFLPCPDGETGRGLVTDSRVGGVILTGSAETARLFLGWRPDLPLFAETSGKNAIIITALADRDQAIRDLVRSAFGHNGQKCSAASLAICEAEVYDDADFRRQLRDGAQSLAVGTAWEPTSRITPLTQAPGAALRRALTALDEGGEWLPEPRPAAAQPH